MTEFAAAPVPGTLLAMAAQSAARLAGNIRTALLLLEGDRLVLEAQHGLTEAEARLLAELPSGITGTMLGQFAERNQARVKLLLTSAMEILGALVVFGAERAADPADLDHKLEEIRSIATLAVEQKNLLEDLTYRAHHDPLTELWNRVWMEEETGRVLANSAGRPVWTGLAVVGLDRFRVINDVLGYQVGNELLRQVGQRIRRELESAYSLARAGGDEFMILLPDLVSPKQVLAAAESVSKCFDEPFRIGDNELIVKTSIGTAVCDGTASSASDFHSRAFTAFRYAKTRSRGRVAPFDPSMVRVPPERLAMEQHLRFALQKREFELYYQPQIDLLTGELVGVEALLRWNHPSLGFISPGIFVPVAEEIGIIEEIGDWVVGEALHQLQEWRTELPDIRMAVNVSALQFSRSNFSSFIAQQLRRAEIAAERLELEVTESAIMTNFEHGLRQMKMLRGLGVMLALDDFGTGHSSLAHLQQFPVHRLKVDRMFVRDIVSRSERPPLLVSIVAMGHALKLSVIAEGVESIEQLLAVSSLQCQEVQGFVFSKPLPARQLLEWAHSRRRELNLHAVEGSGTRQVA